MANMANKAELGCTGGQANKTNADENSHKREVVCDGEKKHRKCAKEYHQGDALVVLGGRSLFGDMRYHAPPYPGDFVSIEHVPHPHSSVPPYNLADAYIFAISPLGIFGAHHFYLDRKRWGFLYMFTFGLCFFGYIIDWFRLPSLVEQANKDSLSYEKECKYSLSDAYVLWLPFGIFGFHHFYLNNDYMGVAYACSLGFCGVGWLMDAVRMTQLVARANEGLIRPFSAEKDINVALALGLSPYGILGGAHYYLDRTDWGILYSCTLGVFGFGYIVDWFRMPQLVRRANNRIRGITSAKLIHTDDVYILWLPPLGILGFHHYYLGRKKWWILYMFTLGVFGIGWLIDLIRIRSLVKEARIRLAEAYKGYTGPIPATLGANWQHNVQAPIDMLGKVPSFGKGSIIREVRDMATTSKMLGKEVVVDLKTGARGLTINVHRATFGKKRTGGAQRTNGYLSPPRSFDDNREARDAAPKPLDPPSMLMLRPNVHVPTVVPWDTEIENDIYDPNMPGGNGQRQGGRRQSSFIIGAFPPKALGRHALRLLRPNRDMPIQLSPRVGTSSGAGFSSSNRRSTNNDDSTGVKKY